MFDILKSRFSANRLNAETYYELALSELERGEPNTGVLSMAMAESGGDETKIEGIYLRLRAKSLEDHNCIKNDQRSNIISEFQRSLASKRISNEKYYELALLELQNNSVKSGVWAIALSKSNGSESLAKSVYLSARVISMKDEDNINTQILRSVIQSLDSSDIEHEVTKSNNEELLNKRQYRSIDEFSKHKNIDIDSIIKMVKDGFYSGRIFDGCWMIHKSEFKK